jgi:chorismate dehydratase
VTPPRETLGIVSYANVAPLHWGLKPWDDARGRLDLAYGVPTELNARLLAGNLTLTLVSSAEFVRHRDQLVALPDFSVATRGRVQSVQLFSRRPWADLHGRRIAVTHDSAASVALLGHLLGRDGIHAEQVTMAPNLEAMLQTADAALLIGDPALRADVSSDLGRLGVTHRVDLAEAWFDATGLPFTFAVWAARRDHPPSRRLVTALRAARERGLENLPAVAEAAAKRTGVPAAAMHAYLARFRYHLNEADWQGLMAYARALDPAARDAQFRRLDA